MAADWSDVRSGDVDNEANCRNGPYTLGGRHTHTECQVLSEDSHSGVAPQSLPPFPNWEHDRRQLSWNIHRPIYPALTPSPPQGERKRSHNRLLDSKNATSVMDPLSVRRFGRGEDGSQLNADDGAVTTGKLIFQLHFMEAPCSKNFKLFTCDPKWAEHEKPLLLRQTFSSVVAWWTRTPTGSTGTQTQLRHFPFST